MTSLNHSVNSGEDGSDGSGSDSDEDGMGGGGGVMPNSVVRAKQKKAVQVKNGVLLFWRKKNFSGQTVLFLSHIVCKMQNKKNSQG